MNIEERISKDMGWWAPGHIAKDGEGFDAYPEKTEKIKQLIRDVLEEVTPKPKKPTNPMMAGYWNATEYMKGKRKELGL